MGIFLSSLGLHFPFSNSFTCVLPQEENFKPLSMPSNPDTEPGAPDDMTSFIGGRTRHNKQFHTMSDRKDNRRAK